MRTDGFRKENFRIQIALPFPPGSKVLETVSGYVLGYFGIHHAKTFWQITHLPTGLRMTPRGEVAPAYLAQAKAIVRKLVAMKVDWATITPSEACKIVHLVRTVYSGGD